MEIKQLHNKFKTKLMQIVKWKLKNSKFEENLVAVIITVTAFLTSLLQFSHSAMLLDMLGLLAWTVTFTIILIYTKSFIKGDSEFNDIKYIPIIYLRSFGKTVLMSLIILLAGLAFYIMNATGLGFCVVVFKYIMLLFRSYIVVIITRLILTLIRQKLIQ